MICQITKDIGGNKKNLAGCIRADKSERLSIKGLVARCDRQFSIDDQKHTECLDNIFNATTDRNTRKFIHDITKISTRQRGRLQKDNSVKYLAPSSTQGAFKEKEILRAKYCVQTLGFIST